MRGGHTMFNDKRRGDIWWAQDTTHKREGI